MNTLVQETVKFFDELFKKYKNINMYMINSPEQGYKNFGLAVMYNLGITNHEIRKNLNLLEYTNDEYNNNAEIDVLFDHKFSDKTTYEIYQENNVIHFNFLHKDGKDFVQLLKIFVTIMANFK